MNQEQNNLNNDNNAQNNNEIQPNNLDNNYFQSPQNNTNMGQEVLNNQPQFTQNNEKSTQSSNKSPKSPKKINLGIIIGIASFVIIATIIGIVVFSKKDNNSTANNQISGPNIKIGDKSLAIKEIVDDEFKVNEYGLIKVGNEYIYKGGDYYYETIYDEEHDRDQLTSKYEQGYLKNFVKINNTYWRIVKINEDKTIKLIWAGTINKDASSRNTVSNVTDFSIQYVQEKTLNYDYENSYLRNYLNTTVLNDASLIPSNYSDILVKTTWDISEYSGYLSEPEIKNQISSFSDYIGVISIKEYNDANFCFNQKGIGEICNNYIENILETAKNVDQLSTNTTNIYKTDVGYVAVLKITRENGDFKVTPNYYADHTSKNGVLPVITLKSTISFKSGDGSVKNPYIIE